MSGDLMDLFWTLFNMGQRIAANCGIPLESLPHIQDVKFHRIYIAVENFKEKQY